jgi:hypothetical protein
LNASLLSHRARKGEGSSVGTFLEFLYEKEGEEWRRVEKRMDAKLLLFSNRTFT